MEVAQADGVDGLARAARPVEHGRRGDIATDASGVGPQDGERACVGGAAARPVGGR